MLQGKYYLVLLLLFVLEEVNAQEYSRIIKQHKLGVAFFDHDLRVPFQERLSKIHHFGFSINYEFSKPKDRVFQFSHNFNVGYFVQKEYFRSYFANYKPTFGLEFGRTFQVYLPIGLGYALSNSTEQNYQFVDGEYVKSKPKRKSHIMPSFGVGATFKLDHLTNIPLAFFGQYEVFALLPYAAKGSLPLTMHTSWMLGLKITLQ